MSRAFTKEDAVEQPFVVPRAPLPEGVPNYVTQRGLQALRDEKSTLEAARPDPEGASGAAALAAHNARLGALEQRIASAMTLDPATLPRDEVRFSAAVTLRNEAGQERSYRIVGVDEAEPQAGRIAFLSPLARELSGKSVGDVVSLRQPRGASDFEIVSIDYVQDDAAMRE